MSSMMQGPRVTYFEEFRDEAFVGWGDPTREGSPASWAFVRVKTTPAQHREIMEALDRVTAEQGETTLDNATERLLTVSAMVLGVTAEPPLDTAENVVDRNSAVEYLPPTVEDPRS